MGTGNYELRFLKAGPKMDIAGDRELELLRKLEALIMENHRLKNVILGVAENSKDALKLDSRGNSYYECHKAVMAFSQITAELK